MSTKTTFPIKKRAPTLYAIIALKLGKGILFLLLALGVYHLADENLPELFRQLLTWLHLDPEKQFFADLTEKIADISSVRMLWLAGGTVFYSLFSLVEGGCLLLRAKWAGWLAIGESAFFIPIEIHELLHRPSIGILLILALNICIVWYLYANRHRLFHHHRSDAN